MAMKRRGGWRNNVWGELEDWEVAVGGRCRLRTFSLVLGSCPGSQNSFTCGEEREGSETRQRCGCFLVVDLRLQLLCGTDAIDCFLSRLLPSSVVYMWAKAGGGQRHQSH